MIENQWLNDIVTQTVAAKTFDQLVDRLAGMSIPHKHIITAMMPSIRDTISRGIDGDGVRNLINNAVTIAQQFQHVSTLADVQSGSDIVHTLDRNGRIVHSPVRPRNVMQIISAFPGSPPSVGDEVMRRVYRQIIDKAVRSGEVFSLPFSWATTCDYYIDHIRTIVNSQLAQACQDTNLDRLGTISVHTNSIKCAHVLCPSSSPQLHDGQINHYGTCGIGEVYLTDVDFDRRPFMLAIAAGDKIGQAPVIIGLGIINVGEATAPDDYCAQSVVSITPTSRRDSVLLDVDYLERVIL